MTCRKRYIPRRRLIL